MKHACKTGNLAVACLVLFLLLGNEAFAAENGNSWRGTYDIIMKWINFSILVFLFIKYVKTPLMNFLNSRKEGLANDIRKLEDEKEKTDTRNKEAMELIEKGEARVAQIKEKILAQGEQEKARIIREANEQSRYMIEEAKQRIGNQIIQAKREFKSDLVDAAIALAIEKLPEKITDSDNQVLLDNYLASMK